MTIDAGFVQWLGQDALYTVSTDAAAAARWGARAVTNEQISPFALKADADAEVARQQAFLGGPLARDTHKVAGQRRDLIGQLVTIVGDRLGYEEGELAFVIAADETQSDASTILTVLKRL